MRASTDIQRSIAAMTIDLHKATRRKQSQADDYRLGEREVQFQYDFAGKVGTLPVEATFTIPFGVMFLGDAGLARQSQLDRPLARLAVELLIYPPGTVTYAHVTGWRYDDDYNYTGAVVNVGVHYPALLVGGRMPTSFDFKGILHAAFQGWGAPLDADSPDGGGMLDPSVDDMGVG